MHNCVMVIIEHRTSQNKEGTVWLLQISGKTEYGHSPLSQIMVNPAQPRTRFEDEALQQLAQSIAANGLLQPVTVREAGRANISW